jgi:hypothetical protein
MKKKCLKCKIEKPLTEYYHNSTASDNRCGSCKECERLYNKKLRENKLKDRIYAF